MDSLSDNAIGDKGAVMISGAVELNRCLVTLEYAARGIMLIMLTIQA